MHTTAGNKLFWIRATVNCVTRAAEIFGTSQLDAKAREFECECVLMYVSYFITLQ